MTPDPPKKVLVLTHLFPEDKDDFRGSFVYDLNVRLAARGYEIQILAPRRPHAPRHEIRDGLTVHHYWFWGWRSGRQLSQLKRRHALTLFTMVANGLCTGLVHALRFRPNLVHAYWVIPAGFIGWVVARLTRRPLVVTAAGSDLNIFASHPLYAFFANRTIRRADAIIACGSQLKARAVAMGAAPEKITVSSGIVKNSSTHPHKKESPNSVPHLKGDKGFQLICVSNLERPKRPETLLRAMKTVVEQSPQAHLTIVGDGSLRKELESLTDALEIRRYITFLGRRPTAEIPHLLAQADLFCHCSDAEGLPVAILEAMVAGLPVVAARVGSIADVVADQQTGFLLSPDDAAGFAQVILTLLQDPQHRRTVAAASLDRAPDLANEARTIHHLESVYTRILNQ